MVRRSWASCKILGTIFLAMVILGCSAKAEPAEVAPRPGALAPAFTAGLLDGGEVTLTDLRGRPVILNFWATWCAPCRREMPRLQAVNSREQMDVAVLAVNYGESAAAISAYVRETGVTLPVVLDGDLALARTYLIFGMPTTFFIDAQGVVQKVHTGELTQDLLDEFLTGMGMIQ